MRENRAETRKDCSLTCCIKNFSKFAKLTKVEGALLANVGGFSSTWKGHSAKGGH